MTTLSKIFKISSRIIEFVIIISGLFCIFNDKYLLAICALLFVTVIILYDIRDTLRLLIIKVH